MPSSDKPHIPYFLKIVRAVDDTVFSRDEPRQIGASFLTRAEIRSGKTVSNDPKDKMLGMVHAAYRGLGLRYMNLLYDGDAGITPEFLGEALEQEFARYGELEKVTLYFKGSDGANKQIELPNVRITHHGSNNEPHQHTLAQALFLYGQAAINLNDRVGEDSKIVGSIGTAINIPINMGKVYHHILSHLETEEHMPHRSAIGLMRRSGLDFDEKAMRPRVQKAEVRRER